MLIDVKGWSPKIDRGNFEEPKNKSVLVEDKV